MPIIANLTFILRIKDPVLLYPPSNFLFYFGTISVGLLTNCLDNKICQLNSTLTEPSKMGLKLANEEISFNRIIGIQYV